MQPESAANERGSIIDAAYACLSEPHSGPIPVAAILQRSGVSTRAFYRHFASKDELFLAMLQRETDALATRLERVIADHTGNPIDQLEAWIEGMFGLIHDDQTRLRFTAIDSDEVRAARGYRELRERARADRERSLVAILRRGRDDGSFPLARPEEDAMAINAVISRLMIAQSYDDHDGDGLKRTKADILDFALRAMGVDRQALR